MKPGALNRICAHPVIISWVFGACALNAAIIGFLSIDGTLSAIAADWQAMLFLLAALILASMLGLFLGMFTCWPRIRIVCSRFNGAPLNTGDHVMILSGPHKGGMADVYEITVGQGGWELARLDLGQERRDRFTDIFEEYALLKIQRGKPDSAASGS
jgi:hypothetical protein